MKKRIEKNRRSGIIAPILNKRTLRVMKKTKILLSYGAIVAIAALNAVNYELFIFPNHFAPSGLNGLCTMFQYLTGISMGWLSLLLNLPLAIAVYLRVSKTLAVRAMTYVAVFSAMLMALGREDALDAFAYSTENGTSTIMGPLVGGILSGAACAVLLRAGAYSGGTDYVASLIHKKRPDMNFFWIGFALNVVVAGVSFFVYDFQLEPVLLCVLYCFAFSTVLDKLNRAGQSAVRFEIITDHPQELEDAIIHQLHHSATVLPGKGVFRGKETNVIICVVNKSQSAQLAAIIRAHEGTFSVVSTVSQVVGNFKHLDTKGHQAATLLDRGDGMGI